MNPANLFWHALSGDQAKFAIGTGQARRFAPGYSPIAAFGDLANPDFAALALHCAPGEQLYCADWSGELPDGWRLDADTMMLRMAWAAPAPTEEQWPAGFPATRPLTPADADQAVALAALTRPGPFGPRTLELGDYLGSFDGGRLIAMAGERLQVGRLREISGVCTHPDVQGRGIARRLMLRLIARQAARGQTPILHVVHTNANARALYVKMGFREEAETVVRVIALNPASTSRPRP